MNEHNPYESPRAVVSDRATEEALAGRGERLGAAILDGIIAMVIILPLMFASGYFNYMRNGDTAPITVLLLWVLIGFAIFAVVQGYPLHATGQTWGKRMMGIKIVDLDGNTPALGKLLVLRYLPFHLVTMIPFLGNLAVLTDSLLIFRNDRRCLHDLIAGTRVVPAR